MGVPILIVDSDTSARIRLRQTLDASGYSIVEAGDVDDGLALLRVCNGPMVALFHVALFNNTLMGTDGIAFLGAAQCEARHGSRHAFVVITPTPDQLHAALGRLLAHLSIPVVAEPVTGEDLITAIDLAARSQLAAVS